MRSKGRVREPGFQFKTSVSSPVNHVDDQVPEHGDSAAHYGLWELGLRARTCVYARAGKGATDPLQPAPWDSLHFQAGGQRGQDAHAQGPLGDLT